MRHYRIIGATLFVVYSVYYIQTPMTWHFIDNIDLVIHEAGHTLFMFFGEFIQIAAGSGFQVVVPLVFCLYFVKMRQYFSSAIISIWLGMSLINVSIYAADAQVMQLPLLGGDASGHDWNALLSMAGLLGYTSQIAGVIWAAGVIVIIFGSILSVMLAYDDKRGMGLKTNNR